MNNIDSAEKKDIKINFIQLKELISEYDPMENDSDIKLFKQQVISVQSIYKLDNHSVRALIANRIKGKALKWLQSRSDATTMQVN